MKDLELREQGPPNTLDATLRTSLDSCARKFYWFLRGVDYANTPPYFVFGRVWQEVQTYWYTRKGDRDWLDPSTLLRHKNESLVHGRAVWDSEGVEGAKNDTWDNLEKLFEEYVKSFILEPWEPLAMEIGWEWPLPGTDYFLAGSLDGYVKWPSYGLLVLENKTMGIYLSDTAIAQWSYSLQITQYIWYLTQLIGEEVFGCLMNLACKRIHGGKTPQFARDLQKRSEFQLEEFESDYRRAFSDLEREWDRWCWPKTSDHIECAGGIGKSPCLCQSFCHSPEIPFTEINPFEYQGIIRREGPWRPWERSGLTKLEPKEGDTSGDNK